MSPWIALLGAVGATIILTRGVVAAPLRDIFPVNTSLGVAIRCAMCSGFWIGLVVAAVLLPHAASVVELPIVAARGVAFAFATSLLAYLAYFVAMLLDELVSAAKKYTGD